MLFRSGTKVSNVRTGKTAWLEDKAHPVIAKINRRITALTHFDLSTSEELQIVNYGSGGQYEPHYDFYYVRIVLREIILTSLEFYPTPVKFFTGRARESHQR